MTYGTLFAVERAPPRSLPFGATITEPRSEARFLDMLELLIIVGNHNEPLDRRHRSGLWPGTISMVTKNRQAPKVHVVPRQFRESKHDEKRVPRN